jgi:hypothetical protein
MLGLLVGVLIVAQFATLALTVLIPPASPKRWDIEEVARMLLGKADSENLEFRSMKGPPDISGSGWLVSETSREALARRLGQRVDHVVLAFYTQLPVGGVTVPADGSRGPMAMADPLENASLTSALIGTAHAQGMRGGPMGGPGNGFPVEDFPAGLSGRRFSRWRCSWRWRSGRWHPGVAIPVAVRRAAARRVAAFRAAMLREGKCPAGYRMAAQQAQAARPQAACRAQQFQPSPTQPIRPPASRSRPAAPPA